MCIKPRVTKQAAITLSFFLSGCTNTRPEIISNPPISERPIEVIVKTTKNIAQVGMTLPIEVKLRNNSNATVEIVPSLDGSDGGRYPRYVIEVRDPNGELVRAEPERLCGNTNCIKLADFVRLDPGEEVDPLHCKQSFGHYMLRYWRPNKLGMYSVRVTYDASASLENARALWSGDLCLEPDPKVWEHLKEMPRGRFQSEWVSVPVND